MHHAVGDRESRNCSIRGCSYSRFEGADWRSRGLIIGPWSETLAADPEVGNLMSQLPLPKTEQSIVADTWLSSNQENITIFGNVFGAEGFHAL